MDMERQDVLKLASKGDDNVVLPGSRYMLARNPKCRLPELGQRNAHVQCMVHR